MVVIEMVEKSERKPSISPGYRLFYVIEGEFRMWVGKKGVNRYRVEILRKGDCFRCSPNVYAGFRGNGELLVIREAEEEFVDWDVFDGREKID